jgi:hypothetical protein
MGEENPKKTQRRGCYKENKIIDNRDTGKQHGDRLDRDG